MAAGAGAGAFRPMSKFVTLLAVADICLLPVVTSAEPSSRAGDNLFAPAVTVVLPLPKDSFHLDDFFEIDGVAGVVEVERDRGAGTEELRRDIGGKAIPGEMGYGI